MDEKLIILLMINGATIISGAARRNYIDVLNRRS